MIRPGVFVDERFPNNPKHRFLADLSKKGEKPVPTPKTLSEEEKRHPLANDGTFF